MLKMLKNGFGPPQPKTSTKPSKPKKAPKKGSAKENKKK